MTILTTLGKTELGDSGYDNWLYLGIGSATDIEDVALAAFGTQLARVAISDRAVSAGVLSGTAFFPATSAERIVKQLGVFSTSGTATLLMYRLLAVGEYITLAAGQGRLIDLSVLFNSTVS